MKIPQTWQVSSHFGFKKANNKEAAKRNNSQALQAFIKNVIYEKGY